MVRCLRTTSVRYNEGRRSCSHIWKPRGSPACLCIYFWSTVKSRWRGVLQQPRVVYLARLAEAYRYGASSQIWVSSQGSTGRCIVAPSSRHSRTPFRVRMSSVVLVERVSLPDTGSVAANAKQASHCYVSDHDGRTAGGHTMVGRLR